MKRVMTAVLAVLLLATVSIGGALPVYAETAHVHTAYEELGVGADLPDNIGPDPSGYEGLSALPLNARPISNAMEFKTMNPSMSYYLTCDLTISETYAETFTGRFYGNGHTITVSAPLFEKLERAIVTDLTVRGKIEQSGTVGAIAKVAVAPELYNVINYADVATTTTNVAGGFFGYVNKSNYTTRFEYCENHGDVTGGQEAGGFIAYMQGTYDEKTDAKKTSALVFEHCLNTGNIVAGNEAGGFVGQPGGGNSDYEWLYTISAVNCANAGAVTGANAGGLFGETHAGHVTIDACYNTGAVTASTADAGGIVARAVFRGQSTGGATVTITNCRNEGTVVGNSAGSCDGAGILGEATLYDNNTPGGLLLIENCQNDGNIAANRPGGIVGNVDCNSVDGRKLEKIYLKNCTNNVQVTSAANYAGGIAARLDVRAADSTVTGFHSAAVALEGCVNNGEVQGKSAQKIGGMVGYSNVMTTKVESKDRPYNYSYNIAFYSCVNNGYIHSIDTNDWVQVGGMIGYTASGAIFDGCVNNGEIRSGGHAGGLAGVVERKVTAANCISAAKVTGGLYIGGLVGKTADGKILCADGQSYSFDGHSFTGCAVLADLVDCDYTDTIHYANKSMGGLAGYLWGSTTVENCAIVSNITGVYTERNDAGGTNSTLENTCTVSAFFGKLGGDAVLTAENNYFSGTLTAGSLGKKAFFANAPDSTKTANWTFSNNYSSLGGLSLYIQLGGTALDAVSDESTTALAGASGSASFLGSMQDFVHVTSCEKEIYAISAAIDTVFGLTRIHAKDYNYYTDSGHDNEYHWNACAVCGAADPSSVTAHAAAAGAKATCCTKLTCADCGTPFGELDPTNHEDTEISWTGNATSHTAVLTCCGTITEDHTFQNGSCTVCTYTCLHGADATCAQGATCETCGLTYNGTAAHTYSDTLWVAGATEGKHYRPCENCNAYDETSGVDCTSTYAANCVNRQQCDVCHGYFGELDSNNHVYANGFTYNINAADENKCEKHYKCCGALAELVEHEARTVATCNERAVCKNCNWNYGELDSTNHEGDEVIYRINESDPEKHDMVYTCCNYTVTSAHTGGKATCTERAKCTLCKNEYGAVNSAHAFDNKCDNQCNDCGMLRSTQHSFGGWLVEKEATETEAGTQMRACVVCGAVQRASIAPATNQDSALLTSPDVADQSDAYIGVIVIAAAGAIVVGIAAGVIVHRKNKKRAK